MDDESTVPKREAITVANAYELLRKVKGTARDDMCDLKVLLDPLWSEPAIIAAVKSKWRRRINSSLNPLVLIALAIACNNYSFNPTTSPYGTHNDYQYIWNRIGLVKIKLPRSVNEAFTRLVAERTTAGYCHALNIPVPSSTAGETAYNESVDYYPRVQRIELPVSYCNMVDLVTTTRLLLPYAKTLDNSNKQ